MPHAPSSNDPWEDGAQKLARLERERDATWQYAAQLAEQCRDLEWEIRQLRGSRSWRWTAPLRWVFHRVPWGSGPPIPPRHARDPLVPPDSLRIEGGNTYVDYVTVGEHFFAHFVQIGGLTPTDRVLDIGAATGRMALPLTRYLRDGGEYFGIEIVAPAVEWAQREFTSRHPNFHFIHADVYNQAYNPAGPQQPSEYRFPFADASFDFAFASSVFTHMYPADVAHYLREASRVLRPGGRLLATFFLLTPESHAAIAAGRAAYAFQHPGDGYRTILAELPEAAIAFEEEEVRRMYRDAGLVIREPIHPGGWSGHEPSKSFQDIVLAARPA